MHTVIICVAADKKVEETTSQTLTNCNICEGSKSKQLPMVFVIINRHLAYNSTEVYLLSR